MNNKDKQRKKEAILRLKMLHDTLGIDKAVISSNENGNIPLSVEYVTGFPIETVNLSDVPDLEIKVKEFEKMYNCTAYYVINTRNVFLSILYVNDDIDNWDYARPDPEGYVPAAVYDLSGKFMEPEEIDFGSCQVVNAGGSLKRIV